MPVGPPHEGVATAECYHHFSDMIWFKGKNAEDVASIVLQTALNSADTMEVGSNQGYMHALQKRLVRDGLVPPRRFSCSEADPFLTQRLERLIKRKAYTVNLEHLRRDVPPEFKYVIACDVVYCTNLAPVFSGIGDWLAHNTDRVFIMLNDACPVDEAFLYYELYRLHGESPVHKTIIFDSDLNYDKFVSPSVAEYYYFIDNSLLEDIYMNPTWKFANKYFPKYWNTGELRNRRFGEFLRLHRVFPGTLRSYYLDKPGVIKHSFADIKWAKSLHLRLARLTRQHQMPGLWIDVLFQNAIAKHIMHRPLFCISGFCRGIQVMLLSVNMSLTPSLSRLFPGLGPIESFEMHMNRKIQKELERQKQYQAKFNRELKKRRPQGNSCPIL